MLLTFSVLPRYGRDITMSTDRHDARNYLILRTAPLEPTQRRTGKEQWLAVIAAELSGPKRGHGPVCLSNKLGLDTCAI